MLDHDSRAALSPDDQLNEVGKRILLLLENTPRLELSELASRLHVPFVLACIAVGWLVRSRVLTLVRGSGDTLSVRFRDLLE